VLLFTGSPDFAELDVELLPEFSALAFLSTTALSGLLLSAPCFLLPTSSFKPKASG
jgi:hypothetical protein